MGLEVRLELAGCRNQCEGDFLHRQVSFFNTAKHPAGVVHGLLHFFLFSNQGGTDGSRGDG